MHPEEFGSFLSEQRKKKNMTQKELTERLNVSTAAVSKWERGKCLPELSKIDDIADIFGISVLEVMKRRISDDPIAAEAVKETYSETAALSETQYRRKFSRWLITGAVIILVAISLYYFPLYHIVQVWFPSYYDTGEISKLAYIGSKDDRKTAEGIMERAEQAFSDLDTPYDDLEEKYGLLSRYAMASERGAVDEEHSLELWSAHFEGSYGCIWVYYNQEAYDENGKVLTGSRNIPSLWYLEKNESGEWIITYIKEHP